MVASDLHQNLPWPKMVKPEQDGWTNGRNNRPETICLSCFVCRGIKMLVKFFADLHGYLKNKIDIHEDRLFVTDYFLGNYLRY